MYRILILTLLVTFVAACGHSDEELAAAVSKREAELMAANKSQLDELRTSQEELLSKRDQKIDGLEQQVAQLEAA